MDKSGGDLGTTIGGAGRPAGYTLAAGDTLGQYKVIRTLGRGGMGEVYEAEHQVLRRRYALKLLPADFAQRPGALERFQREAQVMANLEHPNILKVDDFGDINGRYWLRMELAEGCECRVPGDETRAISLQDLADTAGGKVDQILLAGILRQILDALEYAHGKGVVHRDLKPSNILLNPVDGRDGARPSGGAASVPPLAKIADFGLVRLVGEEWVRSQAQLSVQRSIHLRQGSGGQVSMGELKTTPGQDAAPAGSSTRSMLGTFEYMSPEQKRGENSTAQSDLYSIGLMAYRLLTGRGLSMKTPGQIDPLLDLSWDAFLGKALEENPSDRWASAGEMRKGLEGVQRSMAQIEQERRAQQEDVRPWKAEARRKVEDAAEQRQLEARQRKSEEERLRPERAPAPPYTPRKRKTHAGWWVFAALLTVIGIVWGASRRGERPPTPTPAVSRAPVSQPEPAPPREPAPPPVVQPPAPARPTPAAVPPVTPVPAQRGPVAGQNWRSPATGMEFVWIPQMNMWVGKYEVTNAEYRRMHPNHSSGVYSRYCLNGDRQPVVRVNFANAKAYAEWLTQQDRAVLGGARYRLPSEQEWVTYARCGDNRTYPWGNEWPPPRRRAGNYHGQEGAMTGRKILGYNDGFPVTAPVDHLWANPWGLYGVGGNVWEACARDSTGQSFGAWRGSSWASGGVDGLRVSPRHVYDGSRRNDDRGFRLVLAHP